MIKIIKTDTKNKDTYFLAFLDGIYSNNLLNEVDRIFKNNNVSNNKYGKQAKDIYEALLTNKNNLWVNTDGFKELLKDLD